MIEPDSFFKTKIFNKGSNL